MRRSEAKAILRSSLIPRRFQTPWETRFWRLVDRSDDESKCWDWLGHIDRGGYGKFERVRTNGSTIAHRISYEHRYGHVAANVVIDHLCRNRRCVNPNHLEAVTPRVNILRGTSLPAQNSRRTACVHGHPFTVENTYITPNGRRQCRVCGRRRSSEHARRKAAS